MPTDEDTGHNLNRNQASIETSQAISASGVRDHYPDRTGDYAEATDAGQKQRSSALGNGTALPRAMEDAKASGSGAAAWSTFTRECSRDPLPCRIALVGTFTPRRCGIATFCGDVVEQLARFFPHITVDVYALDDPRRRDRCGPSGLWRHRQG